MPLAEPLENEQDILIPLFTEGFVYSGFNFRARTKNAAYVRKAVSAQCAGLKSIELGAVGFL